MKDGNSGKGHISEEVGVTVKRPSTLMFAGGILQIVGGMIGISQRGILPGVVLACGVLVVGLAVATRRQEGRSVK